MNIDDQFYLACQIIRNLKELVIVLNEMISDPASDDDMKKTLSSTISWMNNHLLAPSLGVAGTQLTGMVNNKNYLEYRDVTLASDYDKVEIKLLARYCYKGLSRGLSEWWAPSDESQIKKEEAVHKVFKSGENYLKMFDIG
jgi:hypothetical protein